MVIDDGFTATLTEVIVELVPPPLQFPHAPHPATSSAHATVAQKPPNHRIARIDFSLSNNCAGNSGELYAFPCAFPVRCLTLAPRRLRRRQRARKPPVELQKINQIRRGRAVQQSRCGIFYIRITSHAEEMI